MKEGVCQAPGKVPTVSAGGAEYVQPNRPATRCRQPREEAINLNLARRLHAAFTECAQPRSGVEGEPSVRCLELRYGEGSR